MTNRICTYTLHICHACLHLLLCYFTGSFINSNSNIIVGDFTDSAYSFQVCGAVCRIQLYKALHTPIDTLHSPFKIVKVFFFFNHSIHTEQLEMMNPSSDTWHPSPALMLVQYTECERITWKTPLNPVRISHARTGSVLVVVIVTQFCSRAKASRHL